MFAAQITNYLADRVPRPLGKAVGREFHLRVDVPHPTYMGKYLSCLNISFFLFLVENIIARLRVLIGGRKIGPFYFFVFSCLELYFTTRSLLSS